MDDPQDDRPAGISRVAECINKVLARIKYISGLFDSKSIVKKVVFRENKNKGGGPFTNPRWGIYIHIYIYRYRYR